MQQKKNTFYHCYCYICLQVSVCMCEVWKGLNVIHPLSIHHLIRSLHNKHQLTDAQTLFFFAYKNMHNTWFIIYDDFWWWLCLKSWIHSKILWMKFKIYANFFHSSNMQMFCLCACRRHSIDRFWFDRFFQCNAISCLCVL